MQLPLSKIHQTAGSHGWAAYNIDNGHGLDLAYVFQW